MLREEANGADFSPTVERDERVTDTATFAALYAQLHLLARRAMRGQPPGHTLQATALLHEAYVRLAANDGRWTSRSHVLRAAAQAMRQILVDHARCRGAQKRGKGFQRIPLEEALVVRDRTGQVIDVLALEDALVELAERSTRQVRIVELRFFHGLTVEEAAGVLGLSPRQVEFDWAQAKSWLGERLGR